MMTVIGDGGDALGPEFLIGFLGRCALESKAKLWLLPFNLNFL